MPKEALIKARVNQATKEAIARIAAERGEAEAVIIREALNALVLKETAPLPKLPASTPTSYIKRKKMP